jgi:NACHT domain
MLKGHIVPDAVYNSKARADEYATTCQPQTRERVLWNLTDWTERDDNQAMCWLYGPAGSGKSTIAHTIAEQCGAKLGASFFFSRGKESRSDATGLFPTLAYQLAIRVPSLQALMERALRSDPLILSRTLDDQFRELILNPILTIKEPLPPMIIVLDALDECSDEAVLARVIRLLGDAFAAHRLPCRFLLTSRPEEHIRNAFARPMTRSKTYSLALQDFPAHDDIYAFLQAQFIDILKDHEVYLRGVPKPWPSSTILAELVEKSEGLFIYVSTLVKYVGQGDDDLPDKKLEAVRRINPGIDPLYKQVLSAALRSRNSRQVIGSVMLLRRSLKISALAQLLQLTSAELRYALRGCHSILIIPDEDDSDIKSYHASLRDFLIDHDRSQDYFIDPKQHEVITQACLRIMASGLVHNTIGDDPLGYACQYWCYHFSARLTLGGVSDTIKSPFGLEVKNLVEKLMDGWLKAWIYNIYYGPSVEEVEEMLLSTCTQLEVGVFCPALHHCSCDLSYLIFKIYREFLAYQSKFWKNLKY